MWDLKIIYIILKIQFGCPYGYAYLYLDVFYPNSYLIINLFNAIYLIIIN